MLWDTFILAVREIKRHVMRSLLTVLGIVIGVASVIIMVTLGSGATVQVTEQIASMGSNLLMVSPGKRLGPGRDSTGAPFKIADADAIARDIRSAAAVSPSSSSAATAIFGNENWSTTITGIGEQYLKARNLEIKTGRAFSSAELHAGAAVCLIGDTIRQKLFGQNDPVGERLRIGKLSFVVVGLLEAKGQSTMGTDQDDIILIPIKTLQRRITGNTDVRLILVSVSEGESTDKAKEDIEKLLRERRRISANEEDDFNVMDMKEITKMLTGTTQVLTALLSAVAAVSLIVGGIGIMNIMLVSVTERTREIGIRLAIGALEREVLLQFLVEAVVLSSAGGLFGIAIGLLTCAALKDVLNVPFVFNAGIVILAFLFSAAVGIVFGYFPARKAASLNPIEALRHE